MTLAGRKKVANERAAKNSQTIDGKILEKNPQNNKGDNFYTYIYTIAQSGHPAS
jgi:hypothetical protein